MLFNFVISPVLSKFTAVEDRIRISRAKLIRYMRLLSQEENIKDQYSSFSSEFRVPTDQKDNYLALLVELENLAKAADINIIDVRPQSRRKKQRYKELIVDLRTEGAIDAYMKFIYDLENSIFLLKIKRIQLTAKANAASLDGNISVSQLAVSE